jgi:hypothetical protein
MGEVARRRAIIHSPPSEDDSITPNSVFEEITKTYKEAEEDLVKFVEKQIDLMKVNLLFGGSDIPSFYSLNKSLMEYEGIALGLLTLHQECRLQYQLNQEKYDNFYADKFVEVKLEQTTLGKQAQFTAARDIELCVRKRYMQELAVLKADIIKAENKYNMINHLVDSWKNYQFILSTLSKNAQAEASAASIASRNPKEMGDE